MCKPWLVGAFSVILKTYGLFAALVASVTCHDPRQMIGHDGHNQKPHTATAEQLSRFLIIAAWCTGDQGSPQ